MKKPVILQLLLALTCLTLASAHAQDSVKKTTAVKPIVVKKQFTNRTTPSFYVTKSADSAKKVAAVPAPPVQAQSDKSLNGQYQYLLTKVYFYQQPLLNAFHKSISDTLTQARQGLKASQAKLVVANKTIDSLQASIKANAQSLTESNQKVDEVSFIGIPVTKETYNWIMWGLVLVFGATAVIVIARSGSSAREATYRTQLYSELEEEYRVYKTKAVEKEKKMARELQTERNKIDELLGRG